MYKNGDLDNEYINLPDNGPAIQTNDMYVFDKPNDNKYGVPIYNCESKNILTCPNERNYHRPFRLSLQEYEIK